MAGLVWPLVLHECAVLAKNQGEQCLGNVAVNQKTFACPVIPLGYPPLRIHEVKLGRMSDEQSRFED
jgi:hypothetical protein